MSSPIYARTIVIGNTTKIQIKRIALIFSRNEIYVFTRDVTPMASQKHCPNCPLLIAHCSQQILNKP